MKNKTYMEKILKANTLEELSQVKASFLSECKKREQRIAVSNILSKVDNFCGAKAMFESLIVPLMGKKEGKNLINKYTKTIKENKSLKTLYTYYEGLNENNSVDSKKAYITEALSLTTPINYNEYVKGVGNIVSIISEAFNMLGDEYVLNNVSNDDKAKLIGESLVYLATTKKNIKNLNEYMSHIDNVSDNIVENTLKDINVDLSLEDIVSEIKKTNENVLINDIFNTDDKEKTFTESKKLCLKMIEEQKSHTKDSEITDKLNEMYNKLSKKEYTFETFTTDMIYMSELQEVLK